MRKKNNKLLKNILLLVVLILTSLCRASLPSKINTITIVTTTDGNDLMFPRTAVDANNGRLILKYGEGTHPTDQTFHTLVSDDWGANWYELDPVPVDPYCSGVVETSLQTGSLFGVAYNSAALSDPCTLRITMHRAWENLSFGSSNGHVLTFPFPVTASSFYGHGDVVLLGDGTILATGYGDSDSTLVASADFGRTWDYRAAMISGTGSEPSLVLLDNGNLLCVSRGTPMEYAISTDDGYTWSTPVSLDVNGVSPRLVKLDDGRIALSYGRPNIYLMIADANGGNWSSPFLVYEGSGCGYTGLTKAPDGHLLLTYSESDFGGDDGLPGTENYLKMTKIAVHSCTGGYFDADLNYDCVVNFYDFALMAQQWTSN